MTRDEILDNLHEQIADRESLIPKDEPDSIFAYDAQVLREVLRLLDGGGDGAMILSGREISAYIR